MSFLNYIKNGLKIAKMDPQGVANIQQEENSFSYALIVIFITSVLGALSQIVHPDVDTVGMNSMVVFAGMFVITFFGAFIGYGIVHLGAKILGGKANIKNYIATSFSLTLWYMVAYLILLLLVRGLSLIAPLLVLLAIPLLLAFVIYSLILSIFVVKEVYGFSWGRAIGAVAIGLAIVFLTVLVLSIVFSLLLYATVGL